MSDVITNAHSSVTTIVNGAVIVNAVSYTHLTLPTIYSV